MNKYLPECFFENLPEPNQRIVRDWMPTADAEPLVVFRRDDATWTVLTDTHLVSTFNGLRMSIPLDRVSSDYDLLHGSSDRKEDQNLIRFPGFDNPIWTPSAEHAALLLNSMFIVFHRNERRRRE
ncbi:MAG: hypothetical protein A4S17_03635 [Proteobacteria bacterium HN_bin10]|nr:MAG: hypothetical protein A4S17_03635 [Proteobacteria bacterium HN_bin10]